MLSVCNNFQIFGNGSDKLFLVADEGGHRVGYVIPNPVLYSLSISCECSGFISSDIHMKAGQVDMIQGKDLDALYDPLMQKSVLELMQAVNKKLMARE